MSRRFSIDAASNLVGALLPRGYPAVREVARLLSVSPRTLQRLLNEEGVSYSDLVERCRCEIACDALEHTDKAIQEIAAILGYRNASSFARAFRRWTGTAPRAYRNQLRDRQSYGFAQAREEVKAPTKVRAKWVEHTPRIR
jgi:AraC-like DNA-binding protein